MLQTLASVARRTGFPVIEEAGWRSRGHANQTTANSVICHHDAAKLRPDQFNTVVRDGRSGLKGPLAHYTIRRDGTIHVVAAGLCYHAGTVSAAIYSNAQSIGIEASNDGLGEPWPAIQIRAYVALCGELTKEFDLPASRVRGHKEVAVPAGRKPDPRGIDMTSFRAQIHNYLTNPSGGFLMSLSATEQRNLYNRIFGMLRQRYWALNSEGKAVEVAPNHKDAKPAAVLDTLDGSYLVGRIAAVEARVAALEVASVDVDKLAALLAPTVTQAINDALARRQAS